MCIERVLLTRFLLLLWYALDGGHCTYTLCYWHQPQNRISGIALPRYMSAPCPPDKYLKVESIAFSNTATCSNVRGCPSFVQLASNALKDCGSDWRGSCFNSHFVSLLCSNSTPVPCWCDRNGTKHISMQVNYTCELATAQQRSEAVVDRQQTTTSPEPDTKRILMWSVGVLTATTVVALIVLTVVLVTRCRRKHTLDETSRKSTAVGDVGQTTLPHTTYNTSSDGIYSEIYDPVSNPYDGKKPESTSNAVSYGERNHTEKQNSSTDFLIMVDNACYGGYSRNSSSSSNAKALPNKNIVVIGSQLCDKNGYDSVQFVPDDDTYVEPSVALGEPTNGEIFDSEQFNAAAGNGQQTGGGFGDCGGPRDRISDNFEWILCENTCYEHVPGNGLISIHQQ